RLPETRRSDFTAAAVASHPAADRPECCLFLPHVAFIRTPRAAPAARGETPASHRGRRGAPLTRRDDRAYRPYVREEQRSQRGCIAGRMQLALHHGLLGHGPAPRVAFVSGPISADRDRCRTVQDPLSRACDHLIDLC